MKLKLHVRAFAVVFMVVTTLILASAVGYGQLRIPGQDPAGSAAPSVVGSGQDRSGLRHYMGGGKIALDAKVSTADSHGELFLWEISVSGKAGPGRHIHVDQDEWFYVLEGEFIAEVGEEQFFLHPGDSVFLPRGVPHTYAHLSDETGKMLGAVLPAGTFEQFLEDSRLAGSKLSLEQTQELFEKHGLKQVGPPIDVVNREQDGLKSEAEVHRPAAESPQQP